MSTKGEPHSDDYRWPEPEPQLDWVRLLLAIAFIIVVTGFSSLAIADHKPAYNTVALGLETNYGVGFVGCEHEADMMDVVTAQIEKGYAVASTKVMGKIAAGQCVVYHRVPITIYRIVFGYDSIGSNGQLEHHTLVHGEASGDKLYFVVVNVRFERSR